MWSQDSYRTFGLLGTLVVITFVRHLCSRLNHHLLRHRSLREMKKVKRKRITPRLFWLWTSSDQCQRVRCIMGVRREQQNNLQELSQTGHYYAPLLRFQLRIYAEHVLKRTIKQLLQLLAHDLIITFAIPYSSFMILQTKDSPHLRQSAINSSTKTFSQRWSIL